MWIKEGKRQKKHGKERRKEICESEKRKIWKEK